MLEKYSIRATFWYFTSQSLVNGTNIRIKKKEMKMESRTGLLLTHNFYWLASLYNFCSWSPSNNFFVKVFVFLIYSAFLDSWSLRSVTACNFNIEIRLNYRVAFKVPPSAKSRFSVLRMNIISLIVLVMDYWSAIYLWVKWVKVTFEHAAMWSCPEAYRMSQSFLILIFAWPIISYKWVHKVRRS